MNTFYALWGVTTPQEAEKIISRQREESGITNPRNLEEQAIFLVGKDIYNILIKGYTEKQWGRKCSDLPPFIIKRLPVRFTFDNNYFSDTYQGIPSGGYNRLISTLLNNIDTEIEIDYMKEKDYFDQKAKIVLFTGKIDEFYNYQYGKLEYRTLKFETEILECENFQGNAVVNYTDVETPYTRIVEHKHFEGIYNSQTVITKEYPSEWTDSSDPYYPINDSKNILLFDQYRKLMDSEKKYLFGGRLAEYKYYDMNHVIENAINLAKKVL
jgi:UDP-galactopyranose mutase